MNSFFNGDDSIGSLTSPDFHIERKYIWFLIGGGRSESLVLELLADSKVVHRATEPNDRAGGSETLTLELWDVTELAGRLATLRIVDNAIGGWGISMWTKSRRLMSGRRDS